MRNFLGKPELKNLYQLIPTYNLINIHARLFLGQAQQFIAEGTAPLTTEPSIWVSSLVLGLWTVGLIGIALWLFQRQEITE